MNAATQTVLYHQDEYLVVQDGNPTAIKVLWCGKNRPSRRGNGWSFPRAVEKTLLQECAGKTTLQLFGGLANFGTRLDVDFQVKPEVVGDAWLPPFARDSFDVVILDPPYTRVNFQEKRALFRAAAWIAREKLIWFHTVWVRGKRWLPLEKAWLVRVGDNCFVRTLQVFRVGIDKPAPVARFERGPAMKYNRWLTSPRNMQLPL